MGAPRVGLSLIGISIVDDFRNTITPVLTVRDAVRAVAFYERAFGSQEIYGNTYRDGRIVAEMAVGPPASGGR